MGHGIQSLIYTRMGFERVATLERKIQALYSTPGLSQNLDVKNLRLIRLPSGKRADTASMPMYEQSGPFVGNGLIIRPACIFRPA